MPKKQLPNVFWFTVGERHVANDPKSRQSILEHVQELYWETLPSKTSLPFYSGYAIKEFIQEHRIVQPLAYAIETLNRTTWHGKSVIGLRAQFANGIIEFALIDHSELLTPIYSYVYAPKSTLPIPKITSPKPSLLWLARYNRFLELAGLKHAGLISNNQVDTYNHDSDCKEVPNNRTYAVIDNGNELNIVVVVDGKITDHIGEYVPTAFDPFSLPSPYTTAYRVWSYIRHGFVQDWDYDADLVFANDPDPLQTPHPVDLPPDIYDPQNPYRHFKHGPF